MNAFIVREWESLDCPSDMVCDAAAGCCVPQRPGCRSSDAACTTDNDCCSGSCQKGVCSKAGPEQSCTSNDDCDSGFCGLLGECEIGGQVCTGGTPGGPGPTCWNDPCVPDGQPAGNGGCCSGGGTQDGICIPIGARAPGLACGKDDECGSLHCGSDCRCTRVPGAAPPEPDGTDCNYGEECQGGQCDLQGKCRSSCGQVGDPCQGDVDCCGAMCGTAGLCVALDCAARGACTADTDCCNGQCQAGLCPGNACRDPGRTCTRDAQCCTGPCQGAPQVGICQ
jgi:hypothetical protein